MTRGMSAKQIADTSEAFGAMSGVIRLEGLLLLRVDSVVESVYRDGTMLLSTFEARATAAPFARAIVCVVSKCFSEPSCDGRLFGPPIVMWSSVGTAFGESLCAVMLDAMELAFEGPLALGDRSASAIDLLIAERLDLRSGIDITQTQTQTQTQGDRDHAETIRD